MNKKVLQTDIDQPTARGSITDNVPRADLQANVPAWSVHDWFDLSKL